MSDGDHEADMDHKIDVKLGMDDEEKPGFSERRLFPIMLFGFYSRFVKSDYIKTVFPSLKI